MIEPTKPTLRAIESDYWTIMLVLEYLRSGLCPDHDELIGNRRAKDQLQIALNDGMLKDVVLRDLGQVDQKTGRLMATVGPALYDSTILRDVVGDGIVEDTSSVICWDGERERHFHLLVSRRAVQELWQTEANDFNAPDPAYRSPFVRLILEAEKHFGDRLSEVGLKKRIEHWLDEHGRQVDPKRWSKSKAEMMATFLRHPDMQRGGAAKTPGGKEEKGGTP